jgi:hypothetical protein
MVVSAREKIEQELGFSLREEDVGRPHCRKRHSKSKGPGAGVRMPV